MFILDYLIIYFYTIDHVEICLSAYKERFDNQKDIETKLKNTRED